MSSLKDEISGLSKAKTSNWFRRIPKSALKSKLLELHKLSDDKQLSIPVTLIYAHFRDKYGLSIKYNQFRIWLRDPLDVT